MEPGHEVDTPATEDGTPLPIRVDAVAVSAQPPEPQLSSQPTQPHPPAGPTPPAVPTAGSLLQAIAAAGGSWFPSRFAVEAGVPRDSLDEPLAELRLAGLVKVAEWVRGLGQGYALTPEGQAAAADTAALARLARTGSPAAPAPAHAAQQKPAEAGVVPEATPAEATEGERFQETELTINPPLVVPALLMANALWFFICAVWSIRWGLTPARALSESHPEILHRFGAVTGVDLVHGEWWRLLSSCFVHIGAIHLIGNMFALAMMGPLAELLWGRGRLLLIYLLSGVAGSALAMALRPESLLAGASGAIWGIQMSLFAWLFTFRRHLPPDLASDWFRRLSVVFILNAGVSFLPGVSWEGHLGGGAAGFMAAGLLNAARFGDRPRRVSAWILLALMPVLCVAGVAAAMDAKGMPGWQHLRQRLAGEQEAHALAERKHKLREAQTEFNKEVAPRAEKLAPVRAARLQLGLIPLNLTPAELDAVWVLKGARRAAPQVAAVRESLRALKATADEVVAHTSNEPTGAESFDQHRERVRAFAAARGHSFDLLIAMLDVPNSPSPEAWAAWQAARADAERLWFELMAPTK